MQSNDNPEANAADGTDDSKPINILNPFTKKIIRELLIEIGSPANQQIVSTTTPDKWVMGIMQKLRHSAVNVLDREEFRKGLINAAALCIAAVKQIDVSFQNEEPECPT